MRPDNRNHLPWNCHCHPGPMWPREETEAARKRVAVKRRLRVLLKEAGVTGVEVR